MAAHPDRSIEPLAPSNLPPGGAPSGPMRDGQVLTDVALHFLARFRAVLLLVPYVLLRAWNTYFLGPNQDVNRYFDAATAWLGHRTPYSQFPLEYPPGALPLFALPKLFLAPAQTLQNLDYSRLFAAEMLVFDLVNLWLLGRLARAFAGPAQAHGTDGVPRAAAWQTVAQLSYIAWTGMLGYLGFERYDLAFACLVLTFVTCAVDGRRRWLADVALALSVWVKMVSVVYLPLYLTYLYHQDRVAQPTGSFAARRWWRREGLVRLGAVAVSLAALFGPFWLSAGDSFLDFMRYHGNRGLQIESTGASLTLLCHHLFGLDVGTRFIYGATEITGAWAPGWARFSPWATLAAVFWVTSQQGRAMAQATSGTAVRALLVRGILALTLGLLFANKVFSPQYMLWLGPLVAAAMLAPGAFIGHEVAALFVANALTVLEIFFYYINILRLEPMATALLVTRNLLIGGLMVALVTNALSPGVARYRTLVLRRARAWVQAPWLHHAALGLCAFWVFAANMSETTANDIWIQLRSGADMWHSLKLPYTEVYSATVSGRPFIAHEWLSGVLFYASTLALGDAGLSVMTAVVALAIFACMYTTFARSERQRLYYLPVLLYFNYLIAFRLLARPHIFTILAQAFMVMAIERWRRHGQIRTLLPLIPMQLIWINLHGAALFGPALMGMVAGCVLLMVLVPRLGESEPRVMSQADVVQTGLMTVGMAVACFINPYGSRIVTFSLDLLGNEYAKNRVWEWTTPFLPMNTYYYWLWLFMFGLALVWAALMLRIKQLPLLDVGYTVLATYLGVRANRFMPDFAVLAFPVVVRALAFATVQGLKPTAWRRQPWLDIGLATLLIANCFSYGYAHSAREHRPMFGWGYGGDMPYNEVALLKKLNVRGVIYNEYSDGSLIINQLAPTIKPVLDSRIDLYPLDFVAEYDQAYVNPALFAQFVQRRHVDVVMLYRHRVAPAILAQLAAAPDWQLLSSSESRVLYVTKRALKRALDGRRPA